VPTGRWRRCWTKPRSGDAGDQGRPETNGIDAVAIVFMHAWKYPAHEQAIADLCRKAGFAQVSVSHEVSPLVKLVGRGDTTVVDAYLSPILRRYVEKVARELGAAPISLSERGGSAGGAGGGELTDRPTPALRATPPPRGEGASTPRLMFMMSSGGLTAAEKFQGKDAILSGPAGGVVGMVETAKSAGFAKVIGFDMGGTSTDVAHYDGEYERAFDTEVAGVRIRAPMMRIHTVAAGGGSVLHCEAGRFRAGPDSAGANPGPASYRRGGPLTVTDANVMLAKLQPEFFPAIFGPDQNQRLDRETVNAKFEALAKDIGDGRTPEAVAEGFITIAVENMANAIKKISVQRGYDVTEYLLNCFGGAGGQHACLVADALGMESVLIHPVFRAAFGLWHRPRLGLRFAPAGAAKASRRDRTARDRCPYRNTQGDCARGACLARHRSNTRLLASGFAHTLRRHGHLPAHPVRRRLDRSRQRCVRASP
jgi:5-oxoprolinase (ATP-hydrolysing)